MLTDFQNIFTCSLPNKFAIKSSLNIPPHLNCVTTLPCEIFMFRNCSLLLEKQVIKTSCVSSVQNCLLVCHPDVKVNGASAIVTCYNCCYPPYVRCRASSPSFSGMVPGTQRVHGTISLLKRETPVFVSPDLWPPNSPDLNPVGYKIWSVTQQSVYRT